MVIIVSYLNPQSQAHKQISQKTSQSRPRTAPNNIRDMAQWKLSFSLSVVKKHVESRRTCRRIEVSKEL